MTIDTKNEQLSSDYSFFVTEIAPKMAPFDDLLNKKYSLEDIASLTKLPEAVVSMQLETIIEYFPKTDITTLMKKHELELIEKEISSGITNLKEIKENLPGFINYAKIRIVLAKKR